MMFEPKKTVYDTLKAITGIVVYQIRPEVIEQFPCVVFSINDNTPNYVLEKDIGSQTIEVVVDIFAIDSKGSGQVLKSVEQAMRAIDFRLIENRDIPDPDGYSHINTVFNINY